MADDYCFVDCSLSTSKPYWKYKFVSFGMNNELVTFARNCEL